MDKGAKTAIGACVEAAMQNVLDNYRPNVLAFDTETTGLRGAVIQAAIVEVTPRGEERECFCGIIPQPDNYKLEPGAVAVHKITQERINREGVAAVPFLREVVRRIKRARSENLPVVAHNSSFDIARMNETLQAHGMCERLHKEDIFCTMQNAKRLCGLKDARGLPKCPKNNELYSILTGDTDLTRFGDLHDAATDARVTALSYAAGRRRGWWCHT